LLSHRHFQSHIDCSFINTVDLTINLQSLTLLFVNSLIVLFVSFEAVVFAVNGFERISDLLLECLFDSICGLHYVSMLGINYKSLIVELIQISIKIISDKAVLS